MTSYLIFLAFIGAMLFSPSAQATSYLIEPDLATAQAISIAKCQAMGCDGVHTKYWWSIIANPSTGQAAIVIEDTPRANAVGDFTNTGLSTAVTKAIGPRAVLLTPQANMDPSWFPAPPSP